MTQNLKTAICQAIKDILKENNLAPERFKIYLEDVKEKEFGDWSLNLAMKLTKEFRKSPEEVAAFLSAQLQKKLKKKKLGQKIKKIEVKPPGFINIFLDNNALYDVLKLIREEKENYGKSKLAKKEKILIEFVSANPTGPLSIAHARQAAVGESLARILKFSGFSVAKEYYINDEGNQILNLGMSLKARYLEALGAKNVEFPKDGYSGLYLKDLAQCLIKEKDKKQVELPAENDLEFFCGYAVGKILKQIKDDLNGFGVQFDNWYSQKELSNSGKIQAVLTELEKKGHLKKEEGATWFNSQKFGDDKNRVLIKSDGQFTYLTPDIAYHKDKFERGYNKLINIWGPDHHGYISRLKAAVCALGHKQEELSILIIQLATLFRAGKPIVMSTRAGEYISLSELIDEVGKDVSCFFFLMRKCESHLEFDLELAKKQSLENPVYYVQYAYARIMSIVRVKEQMYKKLKEDNADFSFLTEPEELNLIKLLSRFPEVVRDCALSLEPQGLTTYLREIAGSFHAFYDKHRVISFDATPDVSLARFVMVKCVLQVIETGLGLLGVNLPKDRM